MTLRKTSKLTIYATVAAAGLVASVAFGRPAAAAVAMPFLLALLLGLAATPRIAVWHHSEFAPERLVEGQTATLRVTLRSSGEVHPADLRVHLPPHLEAVDGPRRGVWLRPGADAVVAMPLRPSRFGSYRLRELRLEASIAFGFLHATAVLPVDHVLRVFPAEESLRRLLRPVRPDLLAGDDVSNRNGDGIEFGEARTYQPGDPVRRIDWRLSSRREELYVRQRREERDAQVVLFLDSFDALGPGDRGTLEMEIRAATTLADHHLRRHDRVGCIGFGGVLRWLTPGAGTLQWYRIVDALLDTAVSTSYAWKEVSIIPPRVLPPNAMVVALSPLLDERVVTALVDLRLRGFDLVVVEVGFEEFLPPPKRGGDLVATRLLRLQHAQVRARLRELGAAVEVWEPGEPLEGVLARLDSARTGARQAVFR